MGHHGAVDGCPLCCALREQAGNEFRVEEVVGKWLRDTGKQCVEQNARIAALEAEVERLKDARRKSVETMQALATKLGLPYPDPKRILAMIEQRMQS